MDKLPDLRGNQFAIFGGEGIQALSQQQRAR
jgi:hypothetical protein